MNSLAAEVGLGAFIFASTNIDDLFVLIAFFSDPQLRRRAIVSGQFLGIAVLYLASLLMALMALSVPRGWIALLGLVPLGLGLRKLWTLREDLRGRDEVAVIQGREHQAQESLHSQILAIASVTVSNGGDNVGVYVPLFASRGESLLVYALVFAVMTAAWCALSHFLVNGLLGAPIRRYGHIGLPFVLIALGMYILAGG